MAQEWFHFEPKGKVLHITLKGQWDENTAKTYCDEYQKFASRFSGDSWGKLVDATKWDCASLSSEKHLRKLVDWSKKNNLTFQINITNNSTMKTFQIQKIFKNKGPIDTHYVNTKADAIKWLHEKGHA
ncbi:MAG: hypothetical protein OCC49_07440 [Fibrobacterales bacterium]